LSYYVYIDKFIALFIRVLLTLINFIPVRKCACFEFSSHNFIGTYSIATKSDFWPDCYVSRSCGGCTGNAKASGLRESIERAGLIAILVVSSPDVFLKL